MNDEARLVAAAEVFGRYFAIPNPSSIEAARAIVDAYHAGYDHKGYSEEKCVRCGWVMGQPPINCSNNSPHVFPSQLETGDEL